MLSRGLGCHWSYFFSHIFFPIAARVKVGSRCYLDLRFQLAIKLNDHNICYSSLITDGISFKIGQNELQTASDNVVVVSRLKWWFP